MTNLEDLAPDSTLELLVRLINNLTERVEGGPGVVLTLSGLLISGQVIPNWQWHEDVKSQAHTGFVRAGGAPDDEHWYEVFFDQVADDLTKQREEIAAARKAVEGLADRFQRAVATQDNVAFIHLCKARVYSPDGSALPGGDGMHWRGRLNAVAGWTFGEIGNSNPDIQAP